MSDRESSDSEDEHAAWLRSRMEAFDGNDYDDASGSDNNDDDVGGASEDVSDDDGHDQSAIDDDDSEDEAPESAPVANRFQDEELNQFSQLYAEAESEGFLALQQLQNKLGSKKYGTSPLEPLLFD